MKREALLQSGNRVFVDSYNCEFGYELISALPYAYWLYEHGLLGGTKSGKGSAPFYWFSPDHKEYEKSRSWYYEDTVAVNKMDQDGIPNAFIHRDKLDLDMWSPPPLKERFRQTTRFKIRDPLYVVYNRYNNEWPATINKPINYFSLEILGDIFDILRGRFEVIYVNVHGQKDLYDNAPPLDLGDYEFCKKYDHVTHIADLLTCGQTFNQVQLGIFAHCERFLTMNGGGSILASYFGGRNLIYTKYCRELQCGDFGYYHLLGGSDICVVNSYDDILNNLL